MADAQVKTVLIVEDDLGLQTIVSEQLTKSNITVLKAGSGKEALDLLETKTPNLIVLDIMLPGGQNGFDVLEQLKRSEKTKSIPVIILTNLDSEMKTAIDIGAVDYIVKSNTSIDQVVSKIISKL
jgi:putative two-component system response regulator